jgi:hypothetical protein
VIIHELAYQGNLNNVISPLSKNAVSFGSPSIVTSAYVLIQVGPKQDNQQRKCFIIIEGCL